MSISIAKENPNNRSVISALSLRPILARTGHGAMADLSPLLGEERKSDFGAVRSVDDPQRT